MDFIFCLLAIACFMMLFHMILRPLLALPGLAFMPMIGWAGDMKTPRILYYPTVILAVLILAISTLVTCAFYSAGIFGVVNHFMEKSNYPLIYMIIGGLASLGIAENFIAIFLSLGWYIAFTTILKSLGKTIYNMGDKAIDLVTSIGMIIVIASLPIMVIVWIYKKIKK